MRPWSLAAAIAFGLGACSGPSGDLTDLAGNTGKREVVTRAFGDPLPDLGPDELARFEAGENTFRRNHNSTSGVGPVMTGIACLGCHDFPPAIGGSNQRLETRFGRRNADGSFDPLLALGGPLLQDQAIGRVASGFTFAPEQLPPEANVVAIRRTTPLFGLGLVDATPDATFQAIAAWQMAHEPGAAGRPAMVLDIPTQQSAVGKFGWKAAHPTLRQFNADAFINEMGITTAFFPDENCPQGDCAALAENPRPDMNDPDGRSLSEAHDFVQFLGPPPRTGSSERGASLFRSVGCAVCHVQTLVTGPHPLAALDRVAYHPFSDFLLHDMGSLGDGIDQGDAKGAEMRTQPLWGVSRQTRLLHDGRVATLGAAILAHDGQGKGARDRFAALTQADQNALLAFLGTL
jgi:CxxC motif-containing protein (DUF1111 family)